MNTVSYAFASLIIGTLASFLILLFNGPFTYRWYVLGLWFAPFVFALFATLPPVRNWPRPPWYHAVILIAVIVPNWLWMWSFPVAAMGDEIRDGALRSSQIVLGYWPNIFGIDWSQGLMSATASSFLYRFLGPDVRIYRAVGAFVVSATIVVAYFATSALTSRAAGLVTALTLAVNHQLMEFARVESLITFTAFIGTAVLLSSAWLATAPGDKLIRPAALLGLLLGFSLWFHASTRVPVFLAAGSASAWLAVRMVRKEILTRPAAKVGLVFAGCILLGVGPSAPFRQSSFLFGTHKLALTSWSELSIRYFDSLTTIWNPQFNRGWVGDGLAGGPLVVVFLALGLLIGFRSHRFLWTAGLLQLTVIPLTNSALTDWVGVPNRMISLVVVCSLLAALAVDAVWRITVKPAARSLVTAMMVLFVGERLWHQSDFFVKDAPALRVPEDHRREFYTSLRQLVEFLRANKSRFPDGRAISVAAQSYAEGEINLAHVSEFFDFFLERRRVMKCGITSGLDPSELVLSSTCPDADQLARRVPIDVCTSELAPLCRSPSRFRLKIIP